MYGLRTAKEARDAKLREWAVGDGIKHILDEVNIKVEQAILKNLDFFSVTVVDEEYKGEDLVADRIKVGRLLASYGYRPQWNQGYLKGENGNKKVWILTCWF